MQKEKNIKTSTYLKRGGGIYFKKNLPKESYLWPWVQSNSLWGQHLLFLLSISGLHEEIIDGTHQEELKTPQTPVRSLTTTNTALFTNAVKKYYFHFINTEPQRSQSTSLAYLLMSRNWLLDPLRPVLPWKCSSLLCGHGYVHSEQSSSLLPNYEHPIATLIKISPDFPKAQSCQDNHTRDSLWPTWNYAWHYKKSPSWWQTTIKPHRQILMKTWWSPQHLKSWGWGGHLQAALLPTAPGIFPLATLNPLLVPTKGADCTYLLVKHIACLGPWSILNKGQKFNQASSHDAMNLFQQVLFLLHKNMAAHLGARVMPKLA